MKILPRLKKFPRLKLPKRKKMRATVARRPLRAAAASYDEMAEPNMKLSRALLIVLLLHVVAVSGIIAFNAIKTRQGPPASRTNSASRTATLAGKDGTSRESVQSDNPGNSETKSGRASSKQSGKDHGKSTDSARREDSKRVYVVAKGDTPVTIAKKFKVSYDELLSLNHIDDPRKLKIGQKLLIPAKSAKGKKDE
jgi:LysM repeat protein